MNADINKGNEAMLLQPTRYEIDHRTIKLIVGVIALALANVTSFFSNAEIQSISASYHEGGWARDVFVGSLFAMSAFFLAYNGQSRHEMLMSKIAAVCAMGVAMFPCGCDGHVELVPHVHGISAAVMFLILAGFCYTFFRRAQAKRYVQARSRAVIYAICGLVIIMSVMTIAIDHLTRGMISTHIGRLTYRGERAGLIAFGLSWLTASRILPVITIREERLKLFS